MATTLTSSAYTDIQFLLQGPSAFNAQPTFNANNPRSPVNFLNGSGDSQAQFIYASQARALAASANEAFVLSDGSMKDPLGNACAFAVVHAIEVVAASTNTGSLKFGAATNPFLGPNSAGFQTLNPGDRLLWCNPVAGWAITGSSNDGLKMLNNSGAVTNYYDIKILGS